MGSYNLIVPSSEADARNWLFGENTTDRTGPEWPLRVCRLSPVTESHNLMVLSSEAHARSWLVEKIATEITFKGLL